MGWHLKGDMPVQFWRTTLVVHAPQPWQFQALRMAMPLETEVLAIDTEAPQRWEDVISKHVGNRKTTAVLIDPSLSQLEDIVIAAHASKTRITLCAWDGQRKFVHIHAPFKTSPFHDRDVHYMRRYFGYFTQVAV